LARPFVGARRPRAGTTEDAHFFADVGGGRLVLGVADGVGTWHARGVDPARYPAALLTGARAAAASTRLPARALAAGAAAAAAAREAGSAAAAVVRLARARGAAAAGGGGGGGGEVRAAGVGDCAVLLLRRRAGERHWALAARLQPQQRDFNWPRQLGWAADAPAGAFDAAASAATLRFASGAGEDLLVIAASDGLTDNVDEEELLALVNGGGGGGGGGDAAAPPPPEPPELQRRLGRLPPPPPPLREPPACAHMEALAARLAARAHAHSLDRRRNGPFARAAAERDIVWTPGGRPDDITVVCALLRAADAAALL